MQTATTERVSDVLPNGIEGRNCETHISHGSAAALVWVQISNDRDEDVDLRLCHSCTKEARNGNASILALARKKHLMRQPRKPS